ncbi:MAG TPA: hypothetical protein VFV05_22285 [Methylomirabilota bacterium]|nr:hypothetical protein [Methylomirabilota bacterium]
MTDERKPDPKADPQVEAERRLRVAMAAEAATERNLRGRIQKGFYGCLTIFVLLFLLALLLS